MAVTTELEKRLAGLSPERRAALLKKVREGRDAERPRESGAIPVRPRDAESYPLSFAQERLWFLDQYEPESAEYNVPQAFRLSGVLDAERLRRALGRLVERHEVLRTVFRQEGEQPRQVIREEAAVSLPVEDLSGAEEPEAEALGSATEDAQRPFDLSTGPLLRARLYRLSAEEHVLYLNVHHIAYDGWSLGILLSELARLYEADAADALPPLPVQYLDFALWQRERLEGEALERQVAYWRRQLAGIPVLELPTDRPRPATRTHEGLAYTFELPEDVSRGVRGLAKSVGATPFAVLLAAYRTLLGRHSGQGDFGVGTLIANRLRRESEALVGFFANTLTLRTDASDDPAFRELVTRERETALEAFAHQELPFEKLVEELSPPRDLARTPLFQAMFILQNAPSDEGGLRLPGLEIAPVGVDSRTAKTDLTLYVTDLGEGFSGFFEYNVDLFDRGTVARMSEHFLRLLAGAVAAPESRISELPLLTDEERRTLVEDWNATERELPEGATIHGLFAARAAENPGAPAVALGDESLTYGELQSRVRALAAHLRGLGAGPETLVGVYLERSLEMVVAVLGVLEAGAAYVPLDPEYPAERVAYMVETSGLPVLVTQARLVEKLPAPAAGGAGPAVVRIDADWPAIAGAAGEADADPARPAADPENLAYVIFTSGSTGKPKGVGVQHRSVVSFLRSMARRPGFAAGETLLAVTTLSG